MEMRSFSSLQERPRCRASDGDGRRCCARIMWNEQTNRPLSTRCQFHGGLADAALMGWSLEEMKDLADTIEPAPVSG